MTHAPALMHDQVNFIAHCVADISLAVDALAHDLQDLLGEVRCRENLEDRLAHVERLLSAALMGEEDESDGCPL